MSTYRAFASWLGNGLPIRNAVPSRWPHSWTIIARTDDPDLWHETRAVSDRRTARRWRYGGGISRPRHQAWTRRRAEAPAAAVHGGRRSRGSLRTRSTITRIAQSSAHRGNLRFRRRRRCAGLGARVGRGRHVERSRAPWPVAPPGGFGRRAADRRRPRRRPPARDYPS